MRSWGTVLSNPYTCVCVCVELLYLGAIVSAEHFNRCIATKRNKHAPTKMVFWLRFYHFYLWGIAICIPCVCCFTGKDFMTTDPWALASTPRPGCRAWLSPSVLSWRIGRLGLTWKRGDIGRPTNSIPIGKMMMFTRVMSPSIGIQSLNKAIHLSIHGSPQNPVACFVPYHNLVWTVYPLVN